MADEAGNSVLIQDTSVHHVRAWSRLIHTRDGRFVSKVGQIGPKWDKSGAFSDQISVHLAQGRQMH